MFFVGIDIPYGEQISPGRLQQRCGMAVRAVSGRCIKELGLHVSALYCAQT